MKVSDYIADFLYAQGVSHVFEMIGGMTTHMIDSIYRQGKIEIVVNHHEQGSAFAADGWARMTGVPGVALATSGPGATNLLTGIGSCYFDSVPAIFITGQVNLKEQKGKSGVRQLGFQETDIVSMAKPITKGSFYVKNADEVPGILKTAFLLALSDRPGPVLIDIPMDIQRQQITADIDCVKVNGKNKIQSEVIPEMLKKLSSAQRPLILAGGGVRSAGMAKQLCDFVERVKVPMVNSLMGIDTIAFNHPLRVGMIGSYGNRWANLAIGEADVILVIGSRLDVRQTGSQTDAFSEGRVIYQVDCDETEINNRVKGCIPVVAQIKEFLETAEKHAQDIIFNDHSDWLKRISELRNLWPDTQELKNIKGINPNRLMHQLSRLSENVSAYVVDVGLHQMWAAQSVELKNNQRFLTSGGMGSMGFALPAAIGAVKGCLGKSVILIAGDGGFQTNIQELETVAHHGLPIKMVVMNNHSLGMVRMFQESYFDKRYPSTCWGYSAPDFVRVANAYGIDACRIESEEQISDALATMWKSPDKPFLLEVDIDAMTNVYPKLAYGKPMTEMEPLAKPIAMESK